MDLARIMHRFLSRSDESADLIRRATEGTAGVLYGTARSMSERNTGGAHSTTDDFVAAAENLCIVRAKSSVLSGRHQSREGQEH